MAYQEDNGAPLFTYAMLAAYIGIFAAQLQGGDGVAVLQGFSWRLGQGQAWRLITSTMLHGSVLHLAFNAVWFFRFSRVIENWLGPWIMLLMYALFAIGSMGFEAIILQWTYLPPVGASGVVYGLFGFLWVMRRRRDDAADAVPVSVSQTMLAWLVICFVVNHFGGHIANAAHIVGLLLGWGLGQGVIAARAWRLPIIASTVTGGLLLGLLTYAPVWRNTAAHLPLLRTRYQPDWLPPEYYMQFEHPPTTHRPSLFL